MLEIFSPFPTMFSKTFSFRAVKSLDCVVKSKHQLFTCINLQNYAFNCLQHNPDFNSYPDKNMILPNLKFANNNFKFDENGTKFSEWLENTVGKEEIACYEQFLLFP